MDLQLEGKVIIVTGGSQRIGEGISRSLAAEGAIPVIASRSVPESEALVAEFREAGILVAFIAHQKFTRRPRTPLSYCTT
jgi:NAD(P)-dependent dehydrogenase (short-subunit alcohol dehydrogenase family)